MCFYPLISILQSYKNDYKGNNNITLLLYLFGGLKVKTETINDDIEKIKKDPLSHQMPYASISQRPCYSILRIGKKYKSIGNIKGFLIHVKREQVTPNANTLKTQENRVIIGGLNPFADIQDYLKDCRIYKNSSIGREILLTSSPQFFKGLSPQEFEKWVDINRGWLQEKFHDNVRYAILHLDETS